MRQIIARVGVLLALTAFGGGGWVTAWPASAPFLVSDARDVQITVRRWNEWQITYEVSGSPTTWVTDNADNEPCEVHHPHHACGRSECIHTCFGRHRVAPV
jgi:hypothetical protein